MKTGPRPGGTSRREPVAVDNMRAAWGESAPDWIVVLAEACDACSQTAIARRIGYSGSVVSQVLNGTYGGVMANVEAAVRATLMAESVECPVAGGTIALSLCFEHQEHVRRRNRSNSFRLAMMRHCPVCPHSRIGGGS